MDVARRSPALPRRVLKRVAERMTIALNVDVSTDRSVGTARLLLFAVLLSMLVSTSAAVGFEIATYIAFAASAELRERLRLAMRHPVVIGMLPFALMVVIATFYGPASWAEATGALIGWRRLLLLPMAAAVFDDEASKRLVLKVVIAAALVAAVVSFATFAADISIARMQPGILFRNYATQGLVQSVAAVICVAALLRAEAFKNDRVLGNRWAMIGTTIVLMTDIVYVLYGRSGYLSLIVMAVVVVAFLAKGSWRTKAASGAGVLLCIALVLVSSSHVRGRVAQALAEIASVDEAPEGTSLGMRVVMWRNTVRMIGDHVVFGVGTGGFQAGYRPYVRGLTGWQSQETGDPHNQFMKIQGEQGLFGLIAFLFFISSALLCAAPAPYRQLAVAVLVGWCATSLANSHFSTFVEGRLLFFWVGAMLGEGGSPSRKHSLRDGGPRAAQL
jgi:O-antigen ligase